MESAGQKQHAEHKECSVIIRLKFLLERTWHYKYCY